MYNYKNRAKKAAISRKMNALKRVVIISDLHCGHNVGLTPSPWQYREVKDDITKRNKFAAVQEEMWKWYLKEIRLCNKYKKPDLLIVNGDCIDGSGKINAGTELITTDRHQQCEMAIDCINRWDAKEIIMIYGTPFHAGKEEDWESIIAKKVGAKIGSHEWISVNNTTFDVKHKVGSSGVPHGRFTAIAKAALWSKLWSEVGLTPKADIIIRSHAHFYSEMRDRDTIGIITPALQGMGSKFGARQCEGLVDIGLVIIDLNNNGIENIDVRLAKLESQVVKATIIK